MKQTVLFPRDGVVAPSLIGCKVCGKECARRSALREHMKYRHPIVGKVVHGIVAPTASVVMADKVNAKVLDVIASSDEEIAHMAASSSGDVWTRKRSFLHMQ